MSQLGYFALGLFGIALIALGMRLWDVAGYVFAAAILFERQREREEREHADPVLRPEQRPHLERRGPQQPETAPLEADAGEDPAFQCRVGGSKWIPNVPARRTSITTRL